MLPLQSARFLVLSAFLAAVAGTAPGAERTPPEKPPQGVRALETRLFTYTGDFDGMLETRILRVLVPYSRTLFFHDRGTAHGVTAQAMHELEKWLNRKHPGKTPFTVTLIPTTRDKLLPGLVAGEGDVAAGDITVTPARMEIVDFTVPRFDGVSEIVVSGPGAPHFAALDDLAGQTVHVRPTTSYYESLVALNERFARQGKPPMRLSPLPNEIEDEDKLDMVNAGLIPVAVMDDWMAEIWARHLPKVKLHRDVAVRTGGQIAFAIRKRSPVLKSELDAFIIGSLRGLDKTIKKTAVAAATQMYDATGSAEMQKFEATIELFRKYGGQYDFDHLMLAAQGYQESRLDQRKKSDVGAIGIMQLMPKTGASLKVGDIRKIDANIHAGAKYMDQLMERYFTDAKFDEQNRTLFAFASYNAGPGNIRKMRDRAAKEGLDPDVWFNNVEHVTARGIGQEPVQYVRNIYKYYVAYKLAQEVKEQAAEAIKRVKGEPQN